MTKLLNSLLRLIELLLIIAGAVLNYFTNNKMGMSRHMTFENYKIMISWKKYIFPVILVLLVIMFVVLILKKKNFAIVLILAGFAFYLYFVNGGRFKLDKYAQMILVFIITAIEFILAYKRKQRT